jgi:Domain of unknown function (DUF4416)
LKSIRFPEPAILFTAILAANEHTYRQVKVDLGLQFGPIIGEQPPETFDYTGYYAAEMGSRLIKGFVVFEPPHHQDDLPRYKHIARGLEWQYGDYGEGTFRRKVNIDPGLITLASVILSTSKNFSHRIAIGNGIFAEVTLMYHPEGWQQLPWTYPDYKSEQVQGFLIRCRDRLKEYLDQQSS